MSFYRFFGSEMSTRLAEFLILLLVCGILALTFVNLIERRSGYRASAREPVLFTGFHGER